MTKAITGETSVGQRLYDEALVQRGAIRKRGGTPPPLPPDLAPALTALQADVLASVGAADPAGALRAAIHKATAAMIAKAVATVTAATKGAAMPTVQEFVQKGGDAYAQLDALAKARVAKVGTRLTYAQAFDAVLATPEGHRLYQAYLREQDAVAARHTKARQAPPDGVR